MLRRASIRDLGQVVDLAVEALQRHPIEELLISRDKITNAARECISSASSFVLVAEEEGKLTGAMVSFTSPMMLYERSDTTLLMLFFKNGEGGQAIREYLRWFETRPALKMMTVTGFGDQELDQRIAKILINRYQFRDDVPYLYKVR